jgi:DNA invertase Pin-like site-specific DNA recombinase
MLAVFAEFERDILRDRVKARIVQARKEGRPHSRPRTITGRAAEVKSLFQRGISKREIAKRLGISRTSIRRFLNEQSPPIP